MLLLDPFNGKKMVEFGKIERRYHEDDHDNRNKSYIFFIFMHRVTSYNTFQGSSPIFKVPSESEDSKILYYILSVLCCCCSVEATEMSEREIQVCQNYQALDSITVLTKAIEVANKQLLQKGQEVAFIDPLKTQVAEPEYLLSLSDGKSEERIDIIHTVNLDHSFKDVNQLAEEINQKVLQHLQAKADPTNFIITEDGCKIDRREVKALSVRQGHLTFDGNFALFRRQPLLANRLHSHTVLKATLQNGIVELSDEYDHIRTDGKKGFFFNVIKDNGKFMRVYRTRESAAPLTSS